MKKYLFIFLISFFTLIPSVNALNFGENYSEFATNKVELARLYGTYGTSSLYGANNNKSACNYTDYNLNCWYNAKLSLVKYEVINISDNRWTTLRFFLENNLYANTSYVGSFKAITNNTTAFVQNFSGQGVNGNRGISKVSCSGSTCEVSFTFTNSTATNELNFQNTLDIPWSFQGLDNIIQELYFVQIKENTSNQDVVDALDKVEDKIDDTNTKLDGIDTAIKDENVDVSDDFLENLESFLPENGVITELITLPITFYTHILNSINSECVPFNLGDFFGSDLIMPCFEVSEYFGSFWNILDLMISGFFVYTIAKKMIAVFNNMTNMEDGDILD